VFENKEIVENGKCPYYFVINTGPFGVGRIFLRRVAA